MAPTRYVEDVAIEAAKELAPGSRFWTRESVQSRFGFTREVAGICLRELHASGALVRGDDGANVWVGLASVPEPTASVRLRNDPRILALSPGDKFPSPSELIADYGFEDEGAARSARCQLASLGIVRKFRHHEARWSSWNYAVGLTAERQAELTAVPKGARSGRRADTTDLTAYDHAAALVALAGKGGLPDSVVLILRAILPD